MSRICGALAGSWAMISNISESIRQQEEAVSNVDDGIEHVLKLSGELKEHFN